MKKMMRQCLVFCGTAMVAMPAFAQMGGAPANEFSQQAISYLAAGLAIGIAAFGGALGQGKASATALDGIARNPNASGKIFTPMLLGLALIESLVLYAFVIALKLAGFF
ncbi:MAG: ATP synthase F0 subunit C [Myxococcales bacterium]|nr:MAG: ATP synthase F0 subunit C [Myxococcales bacterium]